jgi:tetratricopeptide (TPR) repeat protein
VSGSLHERLGYLLIDRLVPIALQHRGVNLEGAPVGYTVDSASSDGRYVAEYSSESSYFTADQKKIRKDFRHALSEHPQVQHLWLVNNTEAGEKISSKLRNSANRIKRRCGITIEIYDSRRTAEFIIDNLLLDSATPIELGPCLPCLKAFSAEMAATYLVPDPSPNFVEREKEMNQVLERLVQEKIVYLSGGSGSGKSDLAAFVVSRIRKRFHMAVWVDAKEVDRAEQLGKFDITGSGATVNIFGALERSTVVVLDDIHTTFNISALHAKCSPESRIIITTQTALPGAIDIGPLGKGESRQILSLGVLDICPDNILEIIRSNVDSNALVLSLLNAYKRESNCSWVELTEISAAADVLLDERHVKVASRLLSRAQQSIGKELKFMRWCGTQTIDRGLAKFIVTNVGIANSEKFRLLSQARPQSLRLHELVFKAMMAIVEVDKNIQESFSNKFAEYIGLHAFSKDIEFYSVIYHHRAQIVEELKKGNLRPAFQYAYFLSTPPKDIISHLIPRSEAILEQLLHVPSSPASELAVLACIEALEKEFLKTREEKGTLAATEYLKSIISTYQKFIETPNLSERLRNSAKHHYAKALRRMGELGSARAIFEEILAGPFPLESSRLQLARIYIDIGQKMAALSSVKTILDSAVESQNGVAATVFLEAVRLLLHPALKPDAQKMFHVYRRKIADRILLFASIGFGQAFEAFSVVAPSLAYSDSKLFEELFQALPPIPSAEQMSSEERKSWGAVFLVASGNTVDPDLINEFGWKAYRLLEVFKDSSDEFTRQRFVKAQLQVCDFDGAIQTLEKSKAESRNEWWYYWLGKAHLGLKQYEKAVNAFNFAIHISKDPRSVFFASRAQARHGLGDTKCIEDFEIAIKMGVGNSTYEISLQEQLRVCKSKFGIS